MLLRTKRFLVSALGPALLACSGANDDPLTPGNPEATSVSIDASTSADSGATAPEATTHAAGTSTGTEEPPVTATRGESGSAAQTSSGDPGATGDTGDAAGSTGDAAGSTGTPAPTGTPSPGCGRSGRPPDGRVVAGDRIYTFPESYDGSTPFPLLYGFHAAGNPIEQIYELTNGSSFEDTHVRAFGKSTGNEWIFGTDRGNVLEIYDDLMDNYCIDMDRVFATGHSSGAGMIMQLLADQETHDHLRFRAVAPVAAWVTGPPRADIPVMYIQAMFDTVRMSSGEEVVDIFRDRNGCQDGSSPYAVSGCMSGSVMVDPGCIAYEGCRVPTVWCSHNDPQYGTSFHGVPCFAVDAMYDFFTGLP